MNPKETDSDTAGGGLEDADEYTRSRQIRVAQGDDTDTSTDIGIEWSDSEIFESEIARSARTAPITDTSNLWVPMETPTHTASDGSAEITDSAGAAQVTSKRAPENKCSHGKRKNYCKKCGGSQICQHGKCKSQCKEC